MLLAFVKMGPDFFTWLFVLVFGSGAWMNPSENAPKRMNHPPPLEI